MADQRAQSAHSHSREERKLTEYLRHDMVPAEEVKAAEDRVRLELNAQWRAKEAEWTAEKAKYLDLLAAEQVERTKERESREREREERTAREKWYQSLLDRHMR